MAKVLSNIKNAKIIKRRGGGGRDCVITERRETKMLGSIGYQISFTPFNILV